MGEGRHKLLLPLGERPILVHVIETTLASQARPIIVVLGYQANEVRRHLSAYLTHPDLFIIENPNYWQGMSSSIHAGVGSLHAESALILLGDQPLMRAHILDTLIATRQATHKAIIVPLYHGQRGHPVLFAAKLFPELMRVTGDEGGRSVIERHHQDMTTVELGTTLASFDVDTWEAYQQVLTAWQGLSGMGNI
jgi:molybdenum cofactor cytidylyltransferase